MKTRIAMLDVLRGLSMFVIVGGDAIILSLCACFPGAVSEAIREQFGHARWEGFSFYDVIFPTFLLISGTASTFSAQRWRSLIRRTLILIGLGILYNGALACTSWSEIRFPSVLARIGLGVFLAAIPYRLLPVKVRPWFFPLGLIAYAALFSLCGGYGEAQSWAGRIDAALIPNANGLDPEGVVSTFGAMLTAYLGMLLGDFLRSSVSHKPLWMALAGAVLIGVASVGAPVCPVVKKLWTSSYVCLAGGWTLLAAALIYLLTDVLNARRFFAPFTFIGLHALWFYLLPRVIDFRGTAHCVINLPLYVLTDNAQVQTLFLSLTSFLLLYGVIWFVRRTSKNGR